MLEEKRILVVRDEADIGELLLLHLTDANAEARLVSDGHTALRCL